MIVSDMPNTQGKTDDLMKLLEYSDMHEKLTEAAIEKAVELLGSDQVEDLEIRMTAEDFAWFAQSIPGMMYRLGIKKPGSDQVYPLHNSEFRVDESALKTGILLLSYLSVELLKTTTV